MKKVAIVTVLISVILIGIYYLIGSMIPKPKRMGDKNMPVEVTVNEVKVKPINIIKILPARIKASEISQVRPQISGVILEKFFEEGSLVKEGQNLYQIDPKPIFVELEKAKIKLKANKVAANAKKDNYDRHLQLFAIKAVSKNQLDEARISMEQAKTNYAIAQSELKLLKIKLNYSNVPAPISGKIGRSYVTKGQLVKDLQEEPLAIITSLERLYADINESSNEIAQIQEALLSNEEVKVQIFLPNNPHEIQANGLLKFSESIVDESSGSVSLRAEFDNSNKKLMPGLFVKVKLDLGIKNSLTVSQSSVIINPDGTMMVYVVSNDNKAIAKNITIAGQSGTDWIISSGLEAGDLVVKEGLQKIRPGANLIPSLSDEEIINTTKNKITKPAKVAESKKAEEPKNTKGKEARSENLNLVYFKNIDHLINNNMLSKEDAAVNS